jgi:hypothetical protein
VRLYHQLRESGSSLQDSIPCVALTSQRGGAYALPHASRCAALALCSRYIGWLGAYLCFAGPALLHLPPLHNVHYACLVEASMGTQSPAHRSAPPLPFMFDIHTDRHCLRQHCCMHRAASTCPSHRKVLLKDCSRCGSGAELTAVWELWCALSP